MRNYLPKLLLCTLSALVIVSCTWTTDEPDPVGKQDDRQTAFASDEEKAIETFNHFIDMMNDDPQTRSTVSRATVSSVRKTSVCAYGDATRSRSSDAPDLATYELTLENPDNTKGFAVVADPAVINEVIAYAPVGAITDTIYNKSMALFFRDLALLSDIISQQAATRADYWQPGWRDLIFNTVPGTTERLYDIINWDNFKSFPNFWYDPLDVLSANAARVQTQWGQGNPYNNKVPNLVTGTQKRVVIGCFNVAASQIMAYHRHPSTYNWNLITSTKMIAKTPELFNHEDFGIDRARETAAQKEVSRLMYDVALAARTIFYPDSPNGRAGVRLNMSVPALNAMGYNVNEINCGDGSVSVQVIKEEMKNRRPILFTGVATLGHAWVVDALMTMEKWAYQKGYHTDPDPNNWVISGGDIPYIDRRRVRQYLIHCNWGWHGMDDGWFYNFNPPKNGDYPMYNSNKHMFIGIEPL